MKNQGPVVGLDIGGANVKAAHSDGTLRSLPFELWKEPAALPDLLSSLLTEMPACRSIAVTMTGELCDCFASRREGVHAILAAVEAAAGAMPVRVWQNTGEWVDTATARARPLATASANWLALAAFAGRFALDGTALLVDVGSTTSDVVPLESGRPCPMGRTDAERLAARELVYTGVRRTPVCALLGGEGAAEWFATTLDVYLVLGRIAADPDDRRTADGRPATLSAAHARLARMILDDVEHCSEARTHALALDLAARQAAMLESAVAAVSARLPRSPATVILAGAGEFLADEVCRRLWPQRIVSLASQLGPEVSAAACAHALAILS